MKNPLAKDRRPAAPASVPEQLAEISAKLDSIQGLLRRVLGEMPAAPGAETPEQRAERFGTLERKLAEGNEA